MNSMLQAIHKAYLHSTRSKSQWCVLLCTNLDAFSKAHIQGSQTYTFGATTVAALTTNLELKRLNEQTLRDAGGDTRLLFVKATAATPAPVSCTDDILVCSLNERLAANSDRQEAAYSIEVNAIPIQISMVTREMTGIGTNTRKFH